MRRKRKRKRGRNKRGRKPKRNKFEFWSNDNFVCSQFECKGCNHGIKKGRKYRCEKIWFENGTRLGEGGFAQVFESRFHGQRAAYKKIPIFVKDDLEKAIEDAHREFDIMQTVSIKPIKGRVFNLKFSF